MKILLFLTLVAWAVADDEASETHWLSNIGDLLSDAMTDYLETHKEEVEKMAVNFLANQIKRSPRAKEDEGPVDMTNQLCQKSELQTLRTCPILKDCLMAERCCDYKSTLMCSLPTSAKEAVDSDKAQTKTAAQRRRVKRHVGKDAEESSGEQAEGESEDGNEEKKGPRAKRRRERGKDKDRVEKERAEEKGKRLRKGKAMKTKKERGEVKGN